MLYALIGYDKPNGLAQRMEHRPDHLAHLDSLGDKLVLAGPFLDAKGDMNGRANMQEFFNGDVTHLPLRDPLTLEVMR